MTLDVPKSFDFSAGRIVDARVGSRKWPWVVAGLTGGVGLVTLAAGLAKGCDYSDEYGGYGVYSTSDSSACDSRDTMLLYGGVLTGVGVVFVIVGAAVGGRRLDLSLAPQQSARFEYRRGRLEARFPSGRWVGLDPGGVSGVF